MQPKKFLYTLLRKSERHSKTDMVYLAHGGFWLTLWQSVTALSALIVSIIFANFLPKEVFGIYRYILSLSAIAGSFSLSGIGGAVTQAVAKGYEQTLVSAFRMNLKWSSLTTLVSWAMATYYYVNGNNTLALALFGIGLILPLYNSFILYGAYLSGKKHFKENAIYGIFLSIVPATLLVSVFFFTQNPAILALVSLGAGLCVAAFFYVYVLRKYKPYGGSSSAALTYGKHASLMGILGVIALQIDGILIFHYIGAAELAAYALALAFPQYIWNLLRNISTLALPKFAAKDIHDIKKVLPKKILLLSAGAALLSLCYILVAPFLFNIFFPLYPEAVIISQVLSLSLLGIASAISITVLQAMLATKKVYVYTFTSSAFHIITAVIFIPLWGVIGAAISYTATRIFSLVLSLILIKNLESSKGPVQK